MYENNPGRKLKDAVSIVTGLSMVGWILLAFVGLVLGSQSEPGYGILALVVGVVGCVSAWLKNLKLAAFADIAINLDKLANGHVGQNTAVAAAES